MGEWANGGVGENTFSPILPFSHSIAQFALSVIVAS